ncbi:MAG: NAD(P)-dependent oxidoreductase [Proteobacteria bacterium]|nr:NAD(P)-dependent oxidoreductase [Pseudomonadota bacterium]
MTVLVTGSAGHLGEALMRSLRRDGRAARGLDLKSSPFTDHIGSIGDRGLVRNCMDGVRTVLHTAALHKPHVGTHSQQDFIDTNVAGTLCLLEEAAKAGVDAFVFTSTTSAFGSALTPPAGAPAAWITEQTAPVPKNIYGATKIAAEQLCELFARRDRMPVVVLRTSRFFPEADDNEKMRGAYQTPNMQVNELLHRRADVADIVNAHLLAATRAPALGFGSYIISATTPFSTDDLAELRRDARGVVTRLFPEAAQIYARRGWKMFPSIDRVYVNAAARGALGWEPGYDFIQALDALRTGRDFRSPLAAEISSKGYHATAFAEGPYPVAP